MEKGVTHPSSMPMHLLHHIHNTPTACNAMWRLQQNQPLSPPPGKVSQHPPFIAPHCPAAHHPFPIRSNCVKTVWPVMQAHQPLLKYAHHIPNASIVANAMCLAQPIKSLAAVYPQGAVNNDTPGKRQTANGKRPNPRPKCQNQHGNASFAICTSFVPNPLPPLHGHGLQQPQRRHHTRSTRIS